MTALETTTELSSEAFAYLDEAPLVRWEPCAAFTDADGHACATCGWLADDHPAPGDDRDGIDAIVVALPTWPVLRRAS